MDLLNQSFLLAADATASCWMLMRQAGVIVLDKKHVTAFARTDFPMSPKTCRPRRCWLGMRTRHLGALRPMRRSRVMPAWRPRWPIWRCARPPSLCIPCRHVGPVRSVSPLTDLHSSMHTDAVTVRTHSITGYVSFITCWEGVIEEACTKFYLVQCQSESLELCAELRTRTRGRRG